MRLPLSLERTLMKAGTFVIPVTWLFLATIVSAAPSTSTLASERVCYESAALSSGVKTAALSQTEWDGLTEQMDMLVRGGGDQSDDDNAAIPDEAPAARIDAGKRIAPTLEPAGILISSRDDLPAHRILSPRSPRGPPVFR
jgi:hypothetical protein